MANKPKPPTSEVAAAFTGIAIGAAIMAVVLFTCWVFGGVTKTPKHWWNCADGYPAKYTCEARLTERPLSDRVEELENHQKWQYDPTKLRLEALERDDEVVKKKLKLPTPTPEATPKVGWTSHCDAQGNCFKYSYIQEK